jgi:hypothetical protein
MYVYPLMRCQCEFGVLIVVVAVAAAVDAVVQQTDVSANSINDMYRKMQRDPAMFNAWLARRVSQYSPTRFEYYCAMSNLYREQFLACMKAVQYLIGPLRNTRGVTGKSEQSLSHERYPDVTSHVVE